MTDQPDDGKQKAAEHVSRFEDWGIPNTQQLMLGLNDLGKRQQAAALALQALESGAFTDPESNTEPLGDVQNPVEQSALLAWLASRCESVLSVEVGFGTGMTAAIILAARRDAKHDFSHLVYDPYGLEGGRGRLAQKFLEAEFAGAFNRVQVRSQFGMGTLASDIESQCDFILVDGDHSFDGVMADFFAADKLLSIGGYMVLDDAMFPAIETLVNFVRSNRTDYEVSFLEIPNTAVLKKVDKDQRAWEHFAPFDVPQREGWTPTRS